MNPELAVLYTLQGFTALLAITTLLLQLIALQRLESHFYRAVIDAASVRAPPTEEEDTSCAVAADDEYADLPDLLLVHECKCCPDHPPPPSEPLLGTSTS